ncbi:MAG: hypothetical protein KDB62_03100 [Solirubrobacterales bacterium]|nr:hypothetical protein [Solirubrobacterales bacterium]
MPRTRIEATLFTDPSSPEAYSASPALRTIEWRYRDQIRWRLVTIGLSAPGSVPERSTGEMARSLTYIRDRCGMPFAIEPKLRHTTSARACQAVIAARLIHPGMEWRVLRALQLMEFNTPILLDEDDHLLIALESVPGLDPLKVVLAIDTPEVQAAYDSEWAESRRATTGSLPPGDRGAERPADTRVAPPTVIFGHEDRRMRVGGLQPAEAYDAAVDELDPGLVRTGPPESPLEVLELYPGGLATQEVAAIMAPRSVAPDRGAVASLLDGLHSLGRVRRIAMGDDAVWLTA